MSVDSNVPVQIFQTFAQIYHSLVLYSGMAIQCEDQIDQHMPNLSTGYSESLTNLPSLAKASFFVSFAHE